MGVDDFSQFEHDWRKAELVPGDLVWRFGRFEAMGWEFIGIPGTRFGVSYYFVSGNEDPVTLARLAALVS